MQSRGGQIGNVQRDVRLIIQTLTASVTKLESFKHTLPFHWTDVEKKAESPEIDTILAALKGGLAQLIEAFGDSQRGSEVKPERDEASERSGHPARGGAGQMKWRK